MKRRTNKQRERQRKHELRRAAQYRSLGKSRYGRKVVAGQMYGPMLSRDQINARVRPEARVVGD